MVRRKVTSAAAAMAAVMMAGLVSGPAWAATAQAETSGGSRTEVVLWTLGTIALALILCTIGFVYRRALGLNRTPPVTLLEPGRKITGE